MAKTRQSQLEANKRWIEKNREKKNHIAMRSSARSFIRNKANQEDLNELLELIHERMEEQQD